MNLAVWGPELSPFVLKLESLLKFAELPFRRLPRDGGRLENIRTAIAIDRAKKQRRACRYPATDPRDEYPLVPLLIIDRADVQFDSSAIALWLDDRTDIPTPPLVPTDPALGFVCRLIDEAFDEFGLYMVHHNRWKLAALDNGAPGLRLAREYSRLLPPLPGAIELFGSWFARRQARRLPYLFSVAPEGYRQPGLASSLTPPSRVGFPPTHELLEESCGAYVTACEQVLTNQPFLLGQRFCLADASAYGQLSMNLTDECAARELQSRSGTVFRWLESIRDGQHSGSSGELGLKPTLRPLIEIILETFVPLMRANQEAYDRYLHAGATRFNEAAFDASECLYEGQLLGYPYRSVAKSFQARVWHDLRADWGALTARAKREINDIAPTHDAAALFL